ncbi:unnamed protein product [Ostreobium quekettii]|uniref:Uncharacterized protein n=1 Tax=Ostreobium quekettii TaxID=121088 RepID=A0A8S1IXU5_9CHLO|nr:unnamed protein product [Ostreobium quekettii]
MLHVVDRGMCSDLVGPDDGSTFCLQLKSSNATAGIAGAPVFFIDDTAPANATLGEVIEAGQPEMDLMVGFVSGVGVCTERYGCPIVAVKAESVYKWIKQAVAHKKK